MRKNFLSSLDANLLRDESDKELSELKAESWEQGAV